MEMMLFRLTDGSSIIPTQGDCGCVGMHDSEPHWLHMDTVENWLLHQSLDAAIPKYKEVGTLAWYAYCEGQSRRLGRLVENMNNHKIAAIEHRPSECRYCHWFYQMKPDKHVNLYQQGCSRDHLPEYDSKDGFPEGPTPRRECVDFEWTMPNLKEYEREQKRKAV